MSLGEGHTLNLPLRVPQNRPNPCSQCNKQRTCSSCALGGVRRVAPDKRVADEAKRAHATDPIRLLLGLTQGAERLKPPLFGHQLCLIVQQCWVRNE
jgi:hypothetical protein